MNPNPNQIWLIMKSGQDPKNPTQFLASSLTAGQVKYDWKGVKEASLFTSQTRLAAFMHALLVNSPAIHRESVVVSNTRDNLKAMGAKL